MEVKLPTRAAHEYIKINVFRPFSGPKATETVCVSARIKDQVGFPVGEVGTVTKTAAQTSFLFWNG